MRTLIYLSIVLSLLVSNAKAQSLDAFNQQLATTVEALDKAQSSDDLQQVRNQFERMNAIASENWLTNYYQAYTDIQLFFRTQDTDAKQNLMKDAETCLNKLKKMKNLVNEERSEISTLSGFWYYAQMSINPQVNGPKYAGVVISSFQEALGLNPENPRAVALNAYFQQNMASFMGSSYPMFEQDIQKAKELSAKEDKDSMYPHWSFEQR